MMRVVSFFSVVLAIFMVSSPSYSATVNCERTTNSSNGYKTQGAFESWWPKNIDLDGENFEEAGSGSKAMVYENVITTTAGHSFTRKWRLLPNNLLIGAVKPFGNFADVNNIRYKCKINSNELRVKLAESNSAVSSQSSTPTTKSSTSSSSKIDKAKSTCTDLGFTAGTEKHGECVLKLMDK